MITNETLKVFDETLNRLKECSDEMRKATLKESDKAYDLLCALKDIKFVLGFNPKHFSKKDKLKEIEEIVDSALKEGEKYVN